MVYTQESYVVNYGSAPGNLSQSSTPVNGSAYLNVIGGQFGVNLTGLAPHPCTTSLLWPPTQRELPPLLLFLVRKEREGEGRGGQGRGE